MKDFTNKVAVITGAASGIGRAYAFAACGLGMKLVLADIERSALDETMNLLERHHGKVVGMQCDVSKAEDVQALADLAIKSYGSVHLVFNNAGVGAGGLIWEHSEADWQWMMGVNLWGVIHGVRIFTPLMLEAALGDAGYRGHIINTASMAGLVNPPAMGIYNASKHAVVAISETLHHDLALVNAPIGVSLACPYFVATGINESRRNFSGEESTSTEPRVGATTITSASAAECAAKEIMEIAMAAGKVSAADVADQVFDAIKERRFYVFTHPAALDSVRHRMENMLHSLMPSNPYQDFPSVQNILRTRLRPLNR